MPGYRGGGGGAAYGPVEFGPVRYAVPPGQMEGLGMPPVVFPYAVAPGQGPVYASVGPMPTHGVPDGVPVRGFSPFGHVPATGGMVRGMATPDLIMDGMERLSLNPMAKEFVPPGMRGVAAMYPGGMQVGIGGGKFSGQAKGKGEAGAAGAGGGAQNGRLRSRKRRSRRSRNQQQALQENIRRTIYISDIDQQVTEEQLAVLFSKCGTVVDCRVCGDPNSAMRFAFVEFLSEEGAQKALKKNGTEIGASRLRVLPSKTAIVPVNKDLMPKNKEEMEQCSRTVYATNIDKKVDRNDVKRFFEALCGPVQKLRLLGDHAHSTRIAFVEFSQAESALAALSCSGALLGTMPIRVSPSKTPVRFCGSHDKE
ncbi:unnamed protein product [Ostreobium quekettii]|uniref:RRM domain-containing protein n=1 Tax=Ostreobium quekettii TaxID=121088 RepID=A0A8S1IUG0_9CHLO|nr:unnamed protein product [Ostreobium quekettii]|eukprot:evm.model.scf_13EXC.11 EVM.evm.TU.scf_13EXC.11   scf_13EXC:149274-150374(-)